MAAQPRKNDGKQLEALVAFVEEVLLPQGFEVKTNERVFNDDHIQIAEFDVEIRGKMGSTEMAWLIECRDRPGSGAAPASWIEQLVGRRDRFGFNKVTAVSTTGFATGAVEYARDAGIELREVKAVTPEEFHWIVGGEMSFLKKVHDLKYIQLLIDESEDQEKQDSLRRALADATSDTQFLKSTTTGEIASAPMAFMGAVAETLFDGLEKDGTARKVRVRATYKDDDHYIVETDKGPIRIRAIEFVGELRIERSSLPLASTRRYEHSEGNGVISQVAIFDPIQVADGQFSLEFHRMGEDGETHVLLRRLPHEKKHGG